MINNLYTGNSITNIGASTLNVGSILRLEEGINYGTSTEYIYVNDFDVLDIIPGSGDNQRVTLNTESIEGRLSRQPFLLGRDLKNSFDYYSEFHDTNELDNKYLTEGVGITIDTVTNFALNFAFLYTPKQGIILDGQRIRDGRLFTRIKKDVSKVTHVIQYFKYIDSTNYYSISYSNGSVSLNKISNGATTQLSTRSGVSIHNAVNHYLYTEFVRERTLHYGSTDGVNYNLYIDDTHGKPLQDEGLVGVAMIGASGRNGWVDRFDVVEHGGLNYTKRIVSNSYANAGVFGVSYPSRLSGTSLFNTTTGASWLVTGNEITRKSGVSLNSWNLYHTTGATFSDFVLETNIRGMSGTRAGLFVGTSSAFYVYSLLFDAVGNSGGVDYYNGSRQFTGNLVPFVKTYNDLNYNLKLSKVGKRLSWFVNDWLTYSTIGVSLADFQNNIVGLATLGLYGASVTFSDLQMSYIDEQKDTVNLTEGSYSSDSISRYLQDRFSIESSSNSFYLRDKSGATTSINIYPSDIISSNKTKYYQNVPTAFLGQGGLNQLIQGTSYYEVYANLSVNYNDVMVSSDMVSDQKTKEVLKNKMINSIKNIHTVELTISGNPTLELWDTIGVSDAYLGSSGIYTIVNHQRTFSAESGEYTSRLSLLPFINE